MNVTVSTQINAASDKVWQAITNIDECADMITAIKKIEVLERPDEGFKGLKWQETREVFGKEAIETMWITKSKPNDFYEACANNHGTLYTSNLKITPNDKGCTLTMNFRGEPQAFSSKLFSILLGWMFKGSMVKMLERDKATKSRNNKGSRRSL